MDNLYHIAMNFEKIFTTHVAGKVVISIWSFFEHDVLRNYNNAHKKYSLIMLLKIVS